MGPSRTMAAAYGRTEKPAPGRWREWYKLWTWRARAEAWDGMIEARARGAVEIEHQQRLVEHLERQRRIATANLSLAESMIAAAARRLATVNVDEIDVKHLPAFIRAAAAVADAGTNAEAQALAVDRLVASFGSY